VVFGNETATAGLLLTWVRTVSPPTDYRYGEGQYSVADIGGHLWTFSQTIADVDPKVWGGILFD
jgi:hypothetical protein